MVGVSSQRLRDERSTRERQDTHTRAVLEALLVSFLWSTSWALIKVGLVGIPPLTFAGLRYALAFLCLLPIALRSGSLRGLGRRDWLALALLGLLLYAVTQGAQFVGLSLLPAATVSLLLSLTPVLVALGGLAFLGERLSRRQWIGLALFVRGSAAYFGTSAVPAGAAIGLAVVLVGALANAASSVLGRSVNRRGHLEPLAVTVASMGVGAAILLASGLALQDLPSLGATEVAIVVWLAVVNTAFAFTLWNRTLRTLSAVESSVINNTMLAQVAVLAWALLGEALDARQVMGLLVAMVGALLVQLRRNRSA